MKAGFFICYRGLSCGDKADSDFSNGHEEAEAFLVQEEGIQMWDFLSGKIGGVIGVEQKHSKLFLTLPPPEAKTCLQGGHNKVIKTTQAGDLA